MIHIEMLGVARSLLPGFSNMIVRRMAAKLMAMMPQSKALITSLRMKKARTTVAMGLSWFTTAIMDAGMNLFTE